MNKSQKIEKCREILHKYADELTIPKRSEDYNFIKDILFNYKPDRIGKGQFPKIFVTDSKWGGNKCFMFLNRYGEVEDFSFYKAIGDDKSRKRTNTLKAFRYEIYDSEVGDIRIKNKLDYNTHVCHAVPFRVILGLFLKKEKVKLSDIKIEPHECLQESRLKDRKLAKKWRKFHLENAKLTIQSKEENFKQRNEIDMPLIALLKRHEIIDK
jgi:hypothetical protein